MLFMIDNIHNERGTYYTDSTLPGYYIMSVVCILYRYQDSALNHMFRLAPINALHVRDLLVLLSFGFLCLDRTEFSVNWHDPSDCIEI